MTGIYFVGGFAAVMTVLHFVSIALAWKRCKLPAHAAPLPASPPAVTLVRPLCGINAFEAETLRSSFQLDYPDYEVIFCVADPEDKVVALARSVMAAHPRVPSRLLTGEAAISKNPKLNNCVRGWEAARHGWIILADSNVLMPPDYIQRLLARWQPETGLVCATPIGSRPQGLWAEMECAFLNTYEARWQYAAERAGMGFAQGKTMLWRRDILERGGGIRALATEIAEDAAATKLVHAQGLKAHLVEGPFEQPLGSRTLRQVWQRQLRWARLRRVTFPVFFLPEIMSGCLFPVLAAGIAADLSGRNGFAMAAGLVALWMAGEALLARAAGWQLTLAFVPAFVLRDIALPILWVAAWAGNEFEWRGNAMSVRTAKL